MCLTPLSTFICDDNYYLKHSPYNVLELSDLCMVLPFSLSELPECHIKIAYNEECLDQLTCISLTPTVRIMSVQLVATLFLCVAYTPLTHPFLAKPLLIRRLLDACAKDRIFRNEDEEDDKVQDMLMLRSVDFPLIYINIAHY